MNKWIGIDPGLTGAVAVFESGSLTIVEDLPTMAKTTGRGRELDAVWFADQLDEWKRGADAIYIELQQPMPRQGVSSTFATGMTYGAICAICSFAHIPVFRVRPNAWKKAAGLLKKDKDCSRTLAMRMWPTHRKEFARKKDHNRAEAALIAYFGGRA